MRAYVASPFFNDREIENIRKIENILTEKGIDVFLPMEHDVSDKENLTNSEWAEKIFEIDKNGIEESDFVVLLYGGMYSDSGTAWECGYAYAIGKKIIVCLYEDVETNLMIVNGSHAFIDGIDKLREYDFVKMPIVKCLKTQK